MILLLIIAVYFPFAIIALTKFSRISLIIIYLVSVLSGSYLASFGTKHVHIFFSDFIFLIIGVRCLLDFINSRKKRADFFSLSIKKDILLPILFYGIYIGFGFLSFLLVSTDKIRSLFAMVEITKNLLYLIVFYSFLKDDKRNIDKVLSWIQLVGIGIALMVIFAGYRFLHQGGDIITLLDPAKNYFVKNEIRFLLGGNNYLAGLLTLLLPVIASMAFAKRHKSLAWLSLTLAVFGVIITASRGAIIALISGAFGVLVLTLSLKIFFTLLALFLSIYIAVDYDSLAVFWLRIQHSFQTRFMLWQEGSEAFLMKALPFGFGIGMYPTVFNSTSIHNCILTAYIEMGIVGGTAFTLALITIFFKIYRKYLKLRRVKSPSSQLFLGILLSISVGLVHSMGEPLMGKHVYDSLFWLLVAIAFAFPVPKSGKLQFRPCLTTTK
ncbi:conserved hypothetical protein [delta proteobacterium NaphS2]|nr:conserved hypothetical protein [delta proteobacterium NaphS2]